MKSIFISLVIPSSRAWVVAPHPSYSFWSSQPGSFRDRTWGLTLSIMWCPLVGRDPFSALIFLTSVWLNLRRLYCGVYSGRDLGLSTKVPSYGHDRTDVAESCLPSLSFSWISQRSFGRLSKVSDSPSKALMRLRLPPAHHARKLSWHQVAQGLSALKQAWLGRRG